MEKPEKDVPVEEPEEPNGSLIEEEIDYEAELEAERKHGKPDPEKAKAAFLEREAKRKEKTGEEEDKPLTKKDLELILAKQSQEIRKETYAERIQEIAQNMANSPAEANLIVEIHKNMMFPDTLSLKEQLEEAYLIANKKKLASVNSELARALKSKDTVSKDTASSYKDGIKVESNMSDSDKSSYQRAGFVFDAKNKLWKKKLPNGKTLVKNPKTKQSWVI